MTLQPAAEDTALARRAAQVQSGGLRAAVMGANDGLVSTLCLVIGVAAAGSDQSAVLLAGFAGLIAGAVSMAAGEWISVRSQVDLFEGILADLRRMVKLDKPALVATLAASYVDRGADQQSAERVASDIARSNTQLFESYASEVVGMNPDELGSPWKTASMSFLLFAVGASIPLAPWLFVSGGAGILLSITLTCLAGLGVGAFIASSSSKPVLRGALRQLLIIGMAATVTYGIGTLFGVAVA